VRCQSDARTGIWHARVMTYLSPHRWTHHGVDYEVNNFHLSDVAEDPLAYPVLFRRPHARVRTRGVGQSLMTVAAILRRAGRVLLVRETRAGIQLWGAPLGRSPGWGLAPHCLAGPAIRAVIGPSS
jgi:hypothetical protein